MALTRASLRLTDEGAFRLLEAAMTAARDMGVPQCIAIVDDGCNLLAFLRMDGARVLSIASAKAKAMTAATTGQPTGNLPKDKALDLAVATRARMTNLPGGLPILVNGHVAGGIGVGSGSSEQDVQVAQAALAAVGL
jgi:glc operon protein GlcG